MSVMLSRLRRAAVLPPPFLSGLLLAAALAVSPASHAGNVCDNGGSPTPRTLTFGEGSGIGGTGSPGVSRNEGIGGTGAPSTTSSGGMGGTGAVAEQGIGGTGAPAENGGSGIGGTGIVGTITGFGSICVNGVEIHYGQSTALRVNGRKGSIRDLAVGQVVAVNAVGTGDEVHAQAIRVINAVAGPITGIDRKRRRLRVLGQTIQLGPRTRFGGQTRGLAGLAPGAYVVVSGLRTDTGAIAATHIARTPPRAAVSIRGPVTAGGNGNFAIYGLRVRTKLPKHVAAGQSVSVSGRLEHDQLAAERVSVQPAIPFHGRLQHLALEGYLGKTNKAGSIRVGAVTVAVARGTRGGGAGQLRPDQRVWVQAHVVRGAGGERIVADRIEIARDRPESGVRGRRPQDGRRTERRGADDGHDHRTVERPGHDRSGGDVSEHHPERQRPEIRPQDIHRPEVQRPEIEKPEFVRPEVQRPDIQLPEIERPERD